MKELKSISADGTYSVISRACVSQRVRPRMVDARKHGQVLLLLLF